MTRLHRKPIDNAPPHPGEFVRAEILAPLGISVSEASLALGITRPALSEFLNQRTDLSADMAIRLEKAFGADMEALLDMQHALNLARARDRRSGIDVPRYVPRLAEKQAKLL